MQVRVERGRRVSLLLVRERSRRLLVLSRISGTGSRPSGLRPDQGF